MGVWVPRLESVEPTGEEVGGFEEFGIEVVEDLVAELGCGEVGRGHSIGCVVRYEVLRSKSMFDRVWRWSLERVSQLQHSIFGLFMRSWLVIAVD